MNAGYLNEYEYVISGGKESYLNTGDAFFTMTKTNANLIKVVSIGDLIDSTLNDNTYSIRTTEYIKSTTKYYGTGSFNDPFMFVEGIPDINVTFAYKETEQTYVVPESGYYTMTAYGAKGNGNGGGNGSKIEGDVYLNEGDEVIIVTGGINGYNGGGDGGGTTGYSKVINGGGSTVVKVNGTTIMISAGGGGSTSESVGGSGGSGLGLSGETGSSTKATAGTNGGGGGGTTSYTPKVYSTCSTGTDTCVGATEYSNCSSCYYGSDAVYTTYYRYYYSCGKGSGKAYVSTPLYPCTSTPSCSFFYSTATNTYSGSYDCNQSHLNAHHISKYGNCATASRYVYNNGSYSGYKSSASAVKWYFYKYTGGSTLNVNGYSLSGYFTYNPGSCYTADGTYQQVLSKASTCSYGCDSTWNPCHSIIDPCQPGYVDGETVSGNGGQGGKNTVTSSLSFVSQTDGGNNDANGWVTLVYDRRN